MRIGVISDTHKDLSLAKIALKEMGKIDLLLHAGDHYRDALVLAKEAGIITKAVSGNCDFFLNKFKEEIIELEDNKILLTHGHQYGVKFDLHKLYYRGLEVGANIIVFGHTHIPTYLVKGDVHILNPGSISLPRGNNKPSYAIIEWNPVLKVRIKEIVK